MADEIKVGYKRPPLHSRFKKGQSGNPKGKPVGTPQTSTTMRKLTSQEVEAVGQMIMMGDAEGLKQVVENRMTSGDSVLKVWVASCAYKALLKGDVGTLETLLARFIGRSPTRVEVTGANGGPLTTAEETPEEREKRQETVKALLSGLQDVQQE